ncbi:hypothetical protein KIPB_007367, partial [Kipferlia bialata]
DMIALNATIGTDEDKERESRRRKETAERERVRSERAKERRAQAEEERLRHRERLETPSLPRPRPVVPSIAHRAHTLRALLTVGAAVQAAKDKAREYVIAKRDYEQCLWAACHIQRSFRIYQRQKRQEEEEAAAALLKRVMRKYMLRLRARQRREACEKLVSFISEVRERGSWSKVVHRFTTSVAMMQAHLTASANARTERRAVIEEMFRRHEGTIIAGEIEAERQVERQRQKAKEVKKDKGKAPTKDKDAQKKTKPTKTKPPTTEEIDALRLHPSVVRVLVAVVHFAILRTRRIFRGEGGAPVFYVVNERQSGMLLSCVRGILHDMDTDRESAGLPVMRRPPTGHNAHRTPKGDAPKLPESARTGEGEGEAEKEADPMQLTSAEADRLEGELLKFIETSQVLHPM